MKPITQILLAIGATTLSTCALACGPTTYAGTFQMKGGIVTIDEAPRCSGDFVYREWKTPQKPYKGKPALRLYSHDSSSYGSSVHFKRKSGAEYILTVPPDAQAPTGDTDYMDRLRLTIIDKDGTRREQTLMRIED